MLGLSPVSAVDTPTYADLRPVLERACVLCHQGPQAPAGLRLDSFEGIEAGGRNGPVVRPGAPGDSELIRRLKGESLPRMPMTGPPYLDAETIARFETWIAAGLPEGEQTGSTQPPVQATASGPPTYLQVAPIFARRCAKCHTDNGLMGPPPEGYRLTSYAATVNPVDRARVIPGEPGASELVRRVRGQSTPRMPFDGPPYLDAAEIDLIERWVATGARDAQGNPAPIPVGARVRFEGRLASRWQVDGVNLRVGPGTRIDKSPGPGDQVEVRARVAADGALEVERLRRR